jgi:hypothetical protein
MGGFYALDAEVCEVEMMMCCRECWCGISTRFDRASGGHGR